MDDPDPYEKWISLPSDVEKLAEQLAGPADAIRPRLLTLYTTVPFSVHYNPDIEKYAMDIPVGATPTPTDFVLVKTAIESVGELHDGAPTIAGGFTKIGASPTLRHLGEWFQHDAQDISGDFIPGHGPVQSMLAGGLVGAGLGYGGGWLAEKLLPEKWKRGKLRKTLGMLGAAAGATPGAIYGMSNLGAGKPFWDNSATNTQYQGVPQLKQGEDQAYKRYQLSAELGPEMLWKARQEAFESAFDKSAYDTMNLGNPHVPPPRSPLDVNIGSMGQTLWEVGADPQTAATTMSTLYAAQQMPGGRGPGIVTPRQMAQLGAHMGAGYVSGGLVGSALGLLTGMPEGTQNTLKRTGMYLGIVRAVVPKLFGN